MANLPYISYYLEEVFGHYLSHTTHINNTIIAYTLMTIIHISYNLYLLIKTMPTLAYNPTFTQNVCPTQRNHNTHTSQKTKNPSNHPHYKYQHTPPISPTPHNTRTPPTYIKITLILLTTILTTPPRHDTHPLVHNSKISKPTTILHTTNIPSLPTQPKIPNHLSIL